MSNTKQREEYNRTGHHEAPLVSIVIINYNGRAVVERCLNSVLDSDYPHLEVILVDNGSTDGSIDLIKRMPRKDQRIRLISNKKNLGPAAGRNIGTRIAKGEYVAYLDNDTEVDPSWLRKAVEVVESDPSIGAIQCKLLLMDQRDRYDYAGDYLSQYGFLIQRVNMGEIDDGRLDKVKEIFSAKSAAMIVRHDVLKQIGLFDKDYFMFVEETDLCWRIWLRGYKVVFAPNSKVYHASGKIAKLVQPQRKFLSKYHGSKNYITTLIKNLDSSNLLRVLPLHLSLWFGIAIWHLLRGRLTEGGWVIMGILWNLTNIKSIWSKRKINQHYVRRVPDDSIMPYIQREKSLSYFYAKVSTPSSGWRV